MSTHFALDILPYYFTFQVTQNNVIGLYIFQQTHVLVALYLAGEQPSGSFLVVAGQEELKKVILFL